LKVLITGVAGFIGSNFADYIINKGFSVIGIDNLSFGIESQIHQDVDFYKMDICSPDIFPLFEGVDTVFHLAAKNSINDCQLDPVATTKYNVLGTVNVFEASYKAGVRLTVYAETAAVYEGLHSYPASETNTSPESFYAVSKACTSMFASAYNRFFGSSLIGLRYFNVYGPRQDYRKLLPPVISAFIISMLKGERPVIYGTGSKRRDFIFIEDLNEFHCFLMNMVDIKSHEVYNVGTGVNYSIKEIYELIEEVLNTGLEPIYKDNLPGEAEVSLANISKITELGWSSSVDLKQGLVSSIEYIKKHVFDKDTK